jgi:hypothetical protein
VVLAVCALGFLVLGAEVRFEHRDVVSRDSAAWIPVVYCALAAVACLLGMGRNGARTAAQYVLALGVGVGAAGLYLHTGGSPGKLRPILDVWTAPASEVGPVWPPAVAPLSIAGLSLVALIAAWGDRKSR